MVDFFLRRLLRGGVGEIRDWLARDPFFHKIIGCVSFQRVPFYWLFCVKVVVVVGS